MSTVSNNIAYPSIRVVVRV